jgi:hypothetical protein
MSAGYDPGSKLIAVHTHHHDDTEPVLTSQLTDNRGLHRSASQIETLVRITDGVKVSRRHLGESLVPIGDNRIAIESLEVSDPAPSDNAARSTKVRFPVKTQSRTFSCCT